MAKGNKPQNTSSGNSGSFDKGLITDVDGFHKQPNQWVSARNAVNNTSLGDIGELSNESSNKSCITLPEPIEDYTIIGAIHLGKDEWVIYSTDDAGSEIGLFKEDSCSYETIVNDQCLAFNKDNLIIGVGRTAFDCGRRVYWDDGINPSRVLDIDNVPYIQNCTTDAGGCITCTDTSDLDCEKIRLAPIIEDLAFSVEQGTSSGQLLNGSYYVVGAYLVEGVRVTDYSLPSNVQGLFNHSNIAGSLDIFVDEADPDFDEFELILVRFVNFNVVATKLGVYSTRQTKITIDALDETLPKIDPALIYIRNNVPDKSDGIYRNGKYLLRVGPTDKFDFNYQPLANQITTKWVSVEYDAEYYRNGGNKTGYMRDEVYAFFIRWVFNTGDKSASYHIPGRYEDPSPSPLTDSVFNNVSNDDVLDYQNINPGENRLQWNTYNTATVDSAFPGTGDTLPDGGVVLGGGKMAYWQSSEIYDDDKPEIWNASYVDPDTGINIGGSNDPAHDLCGKPIRHHKFPDNATDSPDNPVSIPYNTTDMITNHYNPNQGDKIRIMSVQFDNIKPPVDNEGVVLKNVVGYEILRGTRLGNKTVFAKGIINNLREYKPLGDKDNRTYLYPNYPYNPTTPMPGNWDKVLNNPGDYDNTIVDHFLSQKHSTKGSGTQYNSENTLFSRDDTQVNDFNAFLSNDEPLGFPFDGDASGANPFYKEPYFTDRDGNVRKGLVTFHSPDTNFRDPFLSAKELKIYGEVTGAMEGRFQPPAGHPKHKFITNSAFFASVVLGIGYAAIQTEGEKTTEHTSPTIDFGGTYNQVGVSTGTTGNFGTSAPAAIAMATAFNVAQTADTTTDATLSNSIISMLQTAGGFDPTIGRDAALKASSGTAGAAAGVSGSDTVITKKSAWASTPDIIRIAQGVPSFLSLWGEGIDKTLSLIYAFTPYRQYALQQVSHCFYNRFAAPDEGHIRREITAQTYLSPNLQDFASGKDVVNPERYRINNLFRSRTVALELDDTGAILNFPYKANKLDDKGNPIADTQSRDDSQQLYSDIHNRTDGSDGSFYWQSDESVEVPFFKPATSHYVALKQRIDNQYGQLQGVTQVPVSTNSHDLSFDSNGNPQNAKSPFLFNGDVYIGRYTEKNTMFFFYDWLMNQPDGTSFNYALRKYITHPRFWMDTDPFDIAELLTGLSSLFEQETEGSGTGSFDVLMVGPAALAQYNLALEDYENIINDGGTATLPPEPICDCVAINSGLSLTYDAGSFNSANALQTYSASNTLISHTNEEGETANVFYACHLADLPCADGPNEDFTNLLEEWCEYQAIAEQNIIYAQFLDECACYNDGECNQDGDVTDPTTEYGPASGGFENICDASIVSSTYDFKYENVTGNDCSACPGWNNTDKYLDDNKGKWARKIKRVNKQVEKARKKASKIEEKLLKKYQKCLDTTGGGFFNKMAEAIVTPNDKFAFDMQDKSGLSFNIKNAFMYLFVSGVKDFYVESEINVDYRDWGDKEEERHYDYQRYTDLSAVFRPEHIKVGNFMKYDFSLSTSKLFNNFTRWGEMQTRDYDPRVAETCFVHRPKRMLYSLPQDLENKKDNWRVFLTNNYKDFSSTPVNVKAIGKSGAMILFDRESPVQFLGTETLKLDGDTKIQIGDGELFSQPLQNIANADYPHEYGSSQNRLSAVNTPTGLYYISQNQGKIFVFGGKGLQEISNLGMKWWFAKYLPYKLTDDFPDFELTDNPVVGIGCQSVYDNKNQIVYFCKKDWVLRKDITDTVTYVGGRMFKVNGVLDVELGDVRYFKSASWTMSFDPKTKQWVSHHDWHPNLTLASKNTFMTMNSNSVWVHNDTSKSYCNFYGVDYPFEVEFSLHTVGQVNTLRNVMYFMEVYKYADNGDDRFHVLDFNFDQAVIHNSEQCSGLLKLNLKPKNNSIELVNYPVVNSNNIDILYSKEEQKYRFNQFWDITDDRGELTAAERTIFNTEPNGYVRELNPNNLDYNKFELERKKFRHFKNNVILRRQQCGNKNMIIALAAQMNLNSPR
jgi:hypothetical protein